MDKRPTSIDDIVRKHTAACPSVFGIKQTTTTKASLDSSRTASRESLTGALKASQALLDALSNEHTESTSIATRSLLDSSSDKAPSLDEPWGSSRIAYERSSSSPACSSSTVDGTSKHTNNDHGSYIARHLRDRRLNQYMTLSRPSQAGQLVSLAQVGDPTGYPVLVFLGLGCVRYLIALYHELAEASGIRLICIDRWGLGKTHDVSPDSRGMLPWAEVVREVMDQLGVDSFGIMAHSAGVPFAMATALKLKHRVVGTLQLLSPWVDRDNEGGECSWELLT